MGKTSKTLTQALLATTCLTAASLAPAHASLVVEAGDFPDSGPGTELAVGTDEVTGTAVQDIDFFTFLGLQPGQSFTLGYDENEVNGGESMEVFSTTSGPFFFTGSGLGDLSADGSVPGTIPADGKLVVRVQGQEGGGTYSITLDAPLAPPPTPTPAPATLTLSVVGAALAGALGWRRRRTHGRPLA